VLGLAVVFIGAIVLTNLVTNSAAAALMFPIATGIAANGFQTHLMVMKPGGYTFGDFTKVGSILTLVLGVVVVTLASFVYGLAP
jgi:di/tricarboxylate transporter